MRRIKKVLEIGCGPGAQKAIALAIDHPNREIHAIDQRPTELHKTVLHGVKGRTSLPNLKVYGGRSAVDYLREVLAREKRPTYEHVYAQWVLSTMPHNAKKELFCEIHQNMQKGARFSIIDEGFIEGQAIDDLRSAGFVVTTRRLTLNQLIKNPPKDLQLATLIEPMTLLRIGSGTLANYLLQEKLKQKYDFLKQHYGEGKALKLLKEDKRGLRKRLEGYEVGRPSTEAAEAISRMVRQHGNLEKPFVVITATKR